jgi:hypothetical protein
MEKREEPERRDGSEADRLTQLARTRTTPLLVEIVGLLARHKKWWLAPIILVLLLLGLLIALSASGAAPFIYALF